MKVLVTTASKHGSTVDIADVIAGVLSRRGLEVVDVPIGDVVGFEGVDAAVIGSAIYAGHWLPEAKSLIERHEDALLAIPVWLFSSGPIGDPPKPATEPADVAAITKRLGSRDHRVFAGRLDPDHLGMGEKLIVNMLRAPSGDFRDFRAVEAWAHTTADELLGAAAQKVTAEGPVAATP